MVSENKFVGVGVGSNFRRALHISRGLKLLKRKFGLIKISNVYKCDDISEHGEFYWNLAILFLSDLSCHKIKQELKLIEGCCGRLKDDKNNGTATLDLDILATVESGLIKMFPGAINSDFDANNLHIFFPLQELLPEWEFWGTDFQKYKDSILIEDSNFRRLRISERQLI